MKSRVLGAAALAVMFGLTLWLWPTDARRIAAASRELAEAASIPVGEPDLARVTRAATMARLLAPDFELTRAGGVGGISSRDAAVGLATRLRPARGLEVTLGELTIEVSSDGRTAVARTAITLREPGAPGQPDVVETRVATTDWVKDERWTLRRLSVSEPGGPSQSE